MKGKLLTAATVAATLSMSAFATPATPTEIRGYQACLKANVDEFSGLVLERKYLIAESADSRTYYINGTALEDGDRIDVAFSCETTLRGTMVQNLGAKRTQYVAANRGSSQVAGD